MKQEYRLTGFRQEAQFRVFSFAGTDGYGASRVYELRVDTAISQRLGIRIQELPLLCLELLQKREPSDESTSITFREADMRVHTDGVAAAREAQAAKRRPVKRPKGTPPGIGWRIGPIAVPQKDKA